MNRTNPPITLPVQWIRLVVALGLFLVASRLSAQQPVPAVPPNVAELNKALIDARGADSEVRQRIGVRRVIRDAEALLATNPPDLTRFQLLECLFRARQQLVAMDKDPKNREDLLQTCRELVKAPDDLAELRLDADLLLSQVELAKQGATNETRAQALIPFVDRYLNTPVGAKVLRMAMVMALELGDSRVVTRLQEMIVQCFPADLEMIAFQRDKLGGQVIGAPLAGIFERSDGRKVRFPMDVMGRPTLLLFWSGDEFGMTLLKDVAAAALESKSLLQDRLDIVSFNLDDLPDAGESIVRDLGVDWPVLRLPGGKKHPVYDAFVRDDPRMLSISPTGYSALIMSGSGREKKNSDGSPAYGRMFGSNLSRSWNDPRYVAQLNSLVLGEFLIIDPEGGIDPSRPPEWKSLAMGSGGTPIVRNDSYVPASALKTIQECFVPPPLRYRLSPQQARENYGKAVELCRKAIADHPGAPDLWLVRNRLVIALMGLWKTSADLHHFEAAVAEARTALAAGYPEGCDLVARLCLARELLRDPAKDPGLAIDAFIAQGGGERASGPCLAAASLLALDVGDRMRFERYRKRILEQHTEYPMMWIYTAFLLDRHHAYWLFQEPFTAGWSYGRREGYAKSKGDLEEASRILRTELQTLDGQRFRIPEDLDSEWTIIVFSQPGPWSSQRDDGLPPSPERPMAGLNSFAAARPAGDLKVMLATLGGEPEAIRANLEGLKDPKRKIAGVECPVLILPGGLSNPLVQRLGILSEDEGINSVLIRKNGRIALSMSGFLGMRDTRSVEIPANVIGHADEAFISAALGRGDLDAARKLILSLAPPYDPAAVDDRGKKLPIPKHSLPHLRARARVYMALKEWDKALADAEEVVARQLGTDGGMSLRTEELDASEALRDEIRKAKAP